MIERAPLLTGVAAALAIGAAFSAGHGEREPGSRPLDLIGARWQAVEMSLTGTRSTGAIEAVRAEPGSLVLAVDLNENAREGAIFLAQPETMPAFGDQLRSGRQLAFLVDYPPGFTGELQAFVKDTEGRSEYGSMQIVERQDGPRSLLVSLAPSVRQPPMGYQDKGFDPDHGIRLVGLKISAESDRISRSCYQPFRGIIRITRAQIADTGVVAQPTPEVRPPAREPQSLPVLDAADFLAGSGVDRPWPMGYAFSGPLTADHRQELERAYAAQASRGLRFTRVYIGDYRTGLLFDYNGNAVGVEAAFLDYLDELAGIANRHGITVMLSLTDNVMVNGPRAEDAALIRDGAVSDALVDNALAAIVKRLKGRQVIWDVFNEPENVTAVPLREVQRYVDRVLAAGRRADPNARFTVVSRSRAEIIYWQGRGLDLYSHNIFNQRSLEDSLAYSPALDAPIMVAEMAPELATPANLNALRAAGYAGVGIWGLGTRDKYEWPESEMERVVRPLVHCIQAKE